MSEKRATKIRLLILISACLLLAVIIISAALYPLGDAGLYGDYYPAFEAFISHLGHSTSAQYTKWIFRIGIIFCGSSMILTSVCYIKELKQVLKNVQMGSITIDKKTKFWGITYCVLTMICGVCGVLVFVPGDVEPVLNRIHYIGAIGFFLTYILLNLGWQWIRIKSKDLQLSKKINEYKNPNIQRARKEELEEEIPGDLLDARIDFAWALILFATGLALGLCLAMSLTPATIVLQKVVVIQIVISAFILDVEDTLAIYNVPNIHSVKKLSLLQPFKP